MKSPKEMLPPRIKMYLRWLRAWLLSRGLDTRGPFKLSPEEREATTSLSVVIPVHDAPLVTQRCLNSLQLFGGNSEVIIVDDASVHQSTKLLLDQKCLLNGWNLIRNEKSQGHSRASEIGISRSTRPNICLLNSDTIITPRSWAGVIEAFKSSAEIGIAGPATSYTVGSQMVTRAYYCRHHWRDEQIWSFAEQFTFRHRLASLTDVSFVGGFAFFIVRNVWDQLGGFDKNLPDYGNETELCRRAIKEGVRAVFSKASYIHHLGNESYGTTQGGQVINERCLEAKSYIEARHGVRA